MFGIITGFVCLFCFCILLLKALTKRLDRQNADKLIMKLHKPASGLLLLGCIVHIILIFPVIKMRHPVILLTGFTTVGCYLLLIVFCHNRGLRLLPGNHAGKRNVAYKLSLHRIMSVIMLLLVIVHIVFYYIDFALYEQRIASVRLHGIECTLLKDGTYIGEYDAGYIYAQVSVTVTSGIVTDIRLLEHRHQRGQAAEQIVSDIITSQNTNIDAVSGATNSSLVIKKAVENALSIN